MIRRQPNGCGQVSIRVDLNTAAKDARERILVQAGDFLLLQEAPGNAVVRYLTQVINLPFYYLINTGPNLFTGATFAAPGGYGPATVSPMSLNTNVSHSFTAVPGTTTNTVPLPIPTTTGAGR